MPDLALPEALLRSMIVALPLLVVIVLFFLLINSRRQSPMDQAQEPDGRLASHGGDTLVEAQRSETSPELMASTPAAVSSAALGRPQQELRSQKPLASTGLSREDAAEQAVDVQLRIGTAQAAGETAPLAALYLELGRAELAAGNEPAALEAFRSAAGLGALHRAPRAHAEARLELAEIAMRHGDPTTACEHWQMARMAFLDDGAKHEGDKVDRRMRAQGCPTDWVLTDF